MAKTKSSEVSTSLEIAAPEIGKVRFNLLGVTPLIYNAVSLKTMQTLLVPPPKKNATERQSTLKHDPMAEYQASVYQHRFDDRPTRLFFPGGGFKAALKSAALRLPGLKKTEIAQLTWIEGRDIDIYGLPQIYMAGVRSADINRTPDVRTRAILPHWAASITISYGKPQLSDKSVANLVAAAGMLCGIGDGRQEKGYGHGTFEIVPDDHPEFVKLMERGDKERAAQDACLREPECFDIETQHLLQFFGEAVAAMGDRLKKPTTKLKAVA